MVFRRGGSLLPLTSVFASFIGAALVAGVFAYNNYRFSQYKFVNFNELVFYEQAQMFAPQDDKFLLVVFSSNQSNWREILKTIDFYLLQNGANADFQVDLIAIKKDEIKWIENISL